MIAARSLVVEQFNKNKHPGKWSGDGGDGDDDEWYYAIVTLLLERKGSSYDYPVEVTCYIVCARWCDDDDDDDDD